MPVLYRLSIVGDCHPSRFVGTRKEVIANAIRFDKGMADEVGCPPVDENAILAKLNVWRPFSRQINDGRLSWTYTISMAFIPTR